MGVLHELNEETDEAIEEFTKSIEGDPGNEALVIELSRKLVQLKRYTKAEELLTRATARPQASANLFARLGLVYYFLGKKEQAITANNTALKKNPRLLSAYQNLFQLYLQSNQHDDALKVLERASVQPEGQATKCARANLRHESDGRRPGSQRVAQVLPDPIRLRPPTQRQGAAESSLRLCIMVPGQVQHAQPVHRLHIVRG